MFNGLLYSKSIKHYDTGNGNNKRFFLIILLLFLIMLLSYRRCHAHEFLISDYNFTNQNYSFTDIDSFFKNFNNNKMDQGQKWFLYMQARYFEIHPLVLLTKMEMESGLVVNYLTNYRYNWREHRAMGYGLYIHKRVKGKKFYKYGFYKMQVFHGAECLRKWFDKWNEGTMIYINNDTDTAIPTNAATASLFRYTPFYGEHSTHGWNAAGNEVFPKIYSNFSKIWNGGGND